MEKLTEEVTAKYLSDGLRLMKVKIDISSIMKLLRLYQAIQEKGGEVNLRDIAKIEVEVNKELAPRPSINASRI